MHRIIYNEIRRFSAVILIIACVIACPGICRADDLDDGITIDDGIKKYDKIKLDINVGFIKRDALSRAAIKKQDINNLTDPDVGDAVQGGVILKAGAEAGDITVIYTGSDNTLINGN